MSRSILILLVFCILTIVPAFDLSASNLDQLSGQLGSESMRSSPSTAASMDNTVVSRAGDYLRQTQTYWSDYGSQSKGLYDKIQSGQKELDRHGWGRIQDKLRNGQKLTMGEKLKQRVIEGQISKGREAIKQEAKGLIFKPVADGFNLWNSIPPVIRSIVSLF